MKFIAFVFLSMISSFVLAHPGHDHSDWTSFIHHAAWVLPVICLVSFYFFMSVKSFFAKSENQKP